MYRRLIFAMAEWCEDRDRQRMDAIPNIVGLGVWGPAEPDKDKKK